MGDIYIYSAPIQSGKTTLLKKWLFRKDNAAGILTPDINGLRYLFNIQTGEHFPFQAEDSPAIDPEEIVRVGRYSFYRTAFEHARRILTEAVAEEPEWLVIDEIGKLELQNRGFEPAAGHIICRYLESGIPGNLLLVGRTSLLDKIIQHYNLKSSFKLFDMKEMG